MRRDRNERLSRDVAREIEPYREFPNAEFWNKLSTSLMYTRIFVCIIKKDPRIMGSTTLTFLICKPGGKIILSSLIDKAEFFHRTSRTLCVHFASSD